MIDLYMASEEAYKNGYAAGLEAGKNEAMKSVHIKTSTNKAVEAAKTIVEYCKQQNGCQNCIFRLYGCENWHCAIGAFELQTVLSNIEAKKKNHGYM